MASMNWLGFSLSQQQQAQQDLSNTEVSGGECYDMSSESAPPSFMLDSFHRDNHSQDWNLKDAMGMNSMLMGTATTTSSSACNQEPKLENFLGNASSYDHHHHTHTNNNGGYSFSNCGLQLPFESTESVDTDNNHGINVSMIKTWLRNQPGKGEVCGVDQTLTSAQTLSLSMMSGGSAEHAPALPLALLVTESEGNEKPVEDSSVVGAGVVLDAQSGAIEAVPRKSIDTFGQRTSIYRGVTRHRWTGRYEAHLWDNSSRREGQTRKGRQVYLGGYDKEDKAARSYDLAAIKYWGTTTTTNFPILNYEKEIEDMKPMTRQEYVASLRRKSSGFSRGASIYRGVTRHHQHGRWQARIGRVAGNKDLYLGTFSTQEEAAEAYDIAAIKFRGLNAVTNFEINRYDVKAILESSALPIGGAGKRMKEVEDLTNSDRHRSALEKTAVGAHAQLTNGITLAGYHGGWPAIAFQQQPQPLSMHYHPYGQHPRLGWFKQEQDSGTSSPYQDLSNSTHNFFQQPSYNLMGMDGSSMEHSSESNSAMYGGYMMPMGNVMAQEVGSGSQMSDQGNENMYVSGNSYYHHQQGNEQSWIPTAVPAAAIAPRGNNVWNDT